MINTDFGNFVPLSVFLFSLLLGTRDFILENRVPEAAHIAVNLSQAEAAEPVRVNLGCVTGAPVIHPWTEPAISTVLIRFVPDCSDVTDYSCPGVTAPAPLWRPVVSC